MVTVAAKTSEWYSGMSSGSVHCCMIWSKCGRSSQWLPLDISQAPITNRGQGNGALDGPVVALLVVCMRAWCREVIIFSRGGCEMQDERWD